MSVVSEVIGLGIGEEAKGAWVEFLARQTKALYVWRKGGPQSGHYLVIDSQTEAKLSHFGAGIFQGIPTFVDMPIVPVKLFEESQILEQSGIQNPLSLILISASCLIVTPFHQAISRLRETLRMHKKGTVGLGVGEAIRDGQKHPELKILAYELCLPQNEINQKIENVRQYYLAEAKVLTADLDLSEESQIELALLENTSLVSEIAESYVLFSSLVTMRFEGFLDEVISHNTVIETSHGAQLHPRFGYVPHVTQIDPTGQDALKRLYRHDFHDRLRRFGVFRSFSTRLGAGPFVVFDETMTQMEVETHNTDNDWLGRFRKGPLDLVGIAYGIKICQEPPLSGLMISYLDSLKNKDSWPICLAYRYEGDQVDLSDYFEVNNGLITAIKLHPDNGTDKHLIHQQRLTELLSQCSPIFTTITPETGNSLEETFIQFVEKYLDLPVVAVAYGPKMSDRVIRPGYESLFV